MPRFPVGEIAYIHHKAAHIALLFAGRHEFVFKGLKALHRNEYNHNGYPFLESAKIFNHQSANNNATVSALFISAMNDWAFRAIW